MATTELFLRPKHKHRDCLQSNVEEKLGEVGDTSRTSNRYRIPVVKTTEIIKGKI